MLLHGTIRNNNNMPIQIFSSSLSSPVLCMKTIWKLPPHTHTLYSNMYSEQQQILLFSCFHASCSTYTLPRWVSMASMPLLLSEPLLSSFARKRSPTDWSQKDRRKLNYFSCSYLQPLSLFLAGYIPPNVHNVLKVYFLLISLSESYFHFCCFTFQPMRPYKYNIIDMYVFYQKLQSPLLYISSFNMRK